jgi:hypothetical protein
MMVSFRHVAAVRLTITPENDWQRITITSLIGRAQRQASRPRSAAGLKDWTRIEGRQIAAHGAFLYQRTINTQIAVRPAGYLPGYDFSTSRPSTRTARSSATATDPARRRSAGRLRKTYRLLHVTGYAPG